MHYSTPRTYSVVIVTVRCRHAAGYHRLGRHNTYFGRQPVARRGRGMEHRQNVRHADAGPADRRSGVAEPRVRLLAQD